MSILKSLKQLFTNPRFYTCSVILALLFVLGHFVDFIYFVAKLVLIAFLLFAIIDLYLLFALKKHKLYLQRELPERLSNGDENKVVLYVNNSYPFAVRVSIIEELPIEFQKREFGFQLNLDAFAEKKLSCSVKPLQRGDYIFGETHAIITGPIGLFARRFSFGQKEEVIPAYPSFLQMRSYELLAISNRLTEVGVKRVRQVGTHTEFDQIKEYVKGDNYRTINWKATAKNSRLMVNTYQEERSQQVYSIIDMGRSMQMPFEGMTLLDYAINSSLIISNIALQKHDKAGLLTFNTQIESYLPAERKKRTIPVILEILYNQKTAFLESNYSLLATHVRRKITHRSLLILYTNFQSPVSIQRQMGAFKSLAKNHLLLVIMFENTEVSKLLDMNTESLEDIYVKTIAEKYTYDKKLILRELKSHGILSIITRPENLTVNLINKYLELKKVGAI